MLAAAAEADDAGDAHNNNGGDSNKDDKGEDFSHLPSSKINGVYSKTV